MMQKNGLIFLLALLLCLGAMACSKSTGRYVDSAVTDKIIVNVTTKDEVLNLLGPSEEHGQKDGIEVMSWYYMVYDVQLVSGGYQPKMMQSIEVYFNEDGTVKQVLRNDRTGQ